MLSTAAQRLRYVPSGAYTIPQQEYLPLQCNDLALLHPGSHSPTSPPHTPAAAGGVPPPHNQHNTMAVPTLPQQMYAPQLAACAQDSYTLDPSFLMDDFPLLPYDCLLPGADDDRIYYVVPSAEETASPTLSSSPTSPSSANSFSPITDADEFEPQRITPPVLPHFPRAHQQQQHQQQQQYGLQLPEQGNYYYPYQAQAQQLVPQMHVPAPVQVQYQPVYPMGMQYGYACVDPTALGGPASHQQQQQQQQQAAEPAQPPRRDRRTQRQRQPDYVPRPPNPFICFRQDWLRRLQRGEVDYSGPRDQRTMSFRISADWREMPETAKAKFRREALQRKRQHALKYPGYKFAPRQKDRDLEGDDGGAM